MQEAVSKLQWNKPQNDKNYEIIPINKNSVSLQDFVIGPIIAKGCSAAVYAARFVDTAQDGNNDNLKNVDEEAKEDVTAFPLAVKMMFNYDAESNASAILRAMYRETVPARKHYGNDELAIWEQRLAENTVTLPSHPNIVAMYYVFADRIPMLPGSWRMYPDALPARINPNGSGRNMSLFLMMKRSLLFMTRQNRAYNFIHYACYLTSRIDFRYDVTLKQYMAGRNVDTRVSILLFAQLLEALAHMNANGVAHR